MRAAATVAAVGTVGTMMYMAQDAMPAGSFLSKEMTPMEKEFAAYVAQYRKSYGTDEEYAARLAEFSKVHHTIAQHNMQGKSWTLAHNHMSDWTEAEKNALNGYIPRVRESSGFKFDTVDVPAAVDWRGKLQAVDHVKDQGQCGSCWAFSTTGSTESNTEIKSGVYASLSEQQLVDCSQWNNGCGGGNFDFAFDYFQANGAESESDYPYLAYDSTCAYEAKKVVNKKVAGYNDVTPYDSAQLKAAIVEGPTSIAIQANQPVFQHYHSGVIANDGSCGEQLDHAVLAVGYGSEAGQEYIIVKNSWSATWGDKGFVKLAIGDYSGACGCVDQPSHVKID